MESTKDNSIKDISVISREELERRYMNLETEYKSALAKARWYEEQYRLSRGRRFGRSTEKDTISGQMTMEDMGIPIFNEAEKERRPISIEPKEEELNTEDKDGRHKHGRKKKAGALPVVTDTYVLSAEGQACPKCGNRLHEVKKAVRTEIEVIPAKAVVHRYESAVYACRECEKEGGASFVTAPGAPAAMIPGSMVSPSLMADILFRKYVQAVPFYRQEKELKSRGIPVSRNNMCSWAIKVSKEYFRPIADMIREAMYSDGVIHCDETYVEVLKEPGRPAARKSYIWVTTTAEWQKEHPAAIYNYREGRSSTDAREVLKGYKGYIMCDGYASYDSLRKTGKKGEAPMDVTLVACLVHVRRKFIESLKLLSPKDRKGTGAEQAVKKIALIMHTDNKWKELGPEERYIKRKEGLEPLLGDFFRWAYEESLISLPQTKYGQALSYALGQKDKVMHVLLDGRLELDNNMAERAVKPFVIGRKNWLFADSPAGADAGCTIYSIMETAKLNHLNPYEYIKYILEKYPKDHKPEEDELKSLLPWSESIPGYVRNPV